MMEWMGEGQERKTEKKNKTSVAVLLVFAIHSTPYSG